MVPNDENDPRAAREPPEARSDARSEAGPEREPERDADRASDAPPPGEEKEGHRFAFIPDLLKRTFYAGLGAVFTTEEGIRKLASELHLPKDVALGLINQASATKNELFRVVAKELRGFLESLNLSQELQRLLTQVSFEIKTEIRFIPNDEAIVKPEIKRTVSLKRDGADKA